MSATDDQIVNSCT